MSAAIAKELEIRKEYLEDEQINTIYFGGGTPSILSQNELASIIETIHKNFKISKNPEITLETNPDDLNKEKLKELTQIGVNRLSIGIQTFDDKGLKWMNRAHSSQEAVNSVKLSQDAGISNISLDIITGIPVCDSSQHILDTEKALSLRPKHISCYSLTLEPQTTWERLIKSKKYPKPIEEKQADAFMETIEFLRKKDWLHYEISNFALDEEWISKHNSSYWQGERYLGVGPSAHSYNKTERRWNLTSHNEYLAKIEKGETPPFEVEVITNEIAFNEAIMTGIRTSKGVSLEKLITINAIEAERVLEKVKSLKLSNQLEVIDNQIILKQKAKLFADAIAAELFI